MRIVSFITEPNTVDSILDRLWRTRTSRRRQRAPPRRWKSKSTATSLDRFISGPRTWQGESNFLLGSRGSLLGRRGATGDRLGGERIQPKARAGLGHRRVVHVLGVGRRAGRAIRRRLAHQRPHAGLTVSVSAVSAAQPRRVSQRSGWCFADRCTSGKLSYRPPATILLWWQSAVMLA